MILIDWLKKQIQRISPSPLRVGLTEALFTGHIYLYLSKRVTGFGLLVFFRFVLHLFRFRFIAIFFPLIDLNQMTKTIIGLSLLETFWFGYNEDIRQRSRELTPQKFHLLLKHVRKGKLLGSILSICLAVYFLKSTLLPLLVTTRIYSVYDAILGFLILKSMFHFFFLPDFALLQGQSRLPIKRFELYLPEILSLVGLLLITEILGPWGVVIHLGADIFLREAMRLIFLFRAQKNIGIQYSLFKIDFTAFQSSIINSAFVKKNLLGIIQIGFRFEMLALMLLLSTSDELRYDLFLLLPLIRFASDFLKLANFDRMKVRNPLDTIAWYKTRYLYCGFGLMMGLFLIILNSFIFALESEFTIAIVLMLLSTIVTFFLFESYAQVVRIFFFRGIKKAPYFWFCKVRKRSLDPMQLEKLLALGSFFFGRGKIYIPSSNNSEKEKLEWISYFKGGLLSIQLLTRSEIESQLLSKEKCLDLFSADTQNLKLLSSFRTLPRLIAIERMKQANYFLKFADQRKSRNGLGTLSAGVFGKKSVLFFESAPDPTKNTLIFRSRLAQHAIAKQLLKQEDGIPAGIANRIM